VTSPSFSRGWAPLFSSHRLSYFPLPFPALSVFFPPQSISWPFFSPPALMQDFMFGAGSSFLRASRAPLQSHSFLNPFSSSFAWSPSLLTALAVCFFFLGPSQLVRSLQILRTAFATFPSFFPLELHYILSCDLPLKDLFFLGSLPPSHGYG